MIYALCFIKNCCTQLYLFKLKKIYQINKQQRYLSVCFKRLVHHLTSASCDFFNCRGETVIPPFPYFWQYSSPLSKATLPCKNELSPKMCTNTFLKMYVCCSIILLKLTQVSYFLLAIFLTDLLHSGPACRLLMGILLASVKTGCCTSRSTGLIQKGCPYVLWNTSTQDSFADFWIPIHQ